MFLFGLTTLALILFTHFALIFKCIHYYQTASCSPMFNFYASSLIVRIYCVFLLKFKSHPHDVASMVFEGVSVFPWLFFLLDSLYYILL